VLTDDPPLQPESSSARDSTRTRAKKTQVDFEIVLNYGPEVAQGPDALEQYLSDPPLPKEMDPIGYWLKQRKAGEAVANPSATALAQMALDYLSVPGLSFQCKFVRA
jgi:hypothetical protein